MKKVNSYEAQGGRRVDVFGGVISESELRTGDEIVFNVGIHGLLARVAEHLEKKSVIDVYLEDQAHKWLGRHIIEYSVMDGRSDAERGSRRGLKGEVRGQLRLEVLNDNEENLPRRSLGSRKPLSTGVKFAESVRAQGIEMSEYVERSLIGPASAGSPRVIRETS